MAPAPPIPSNEWERLEDLYRLQLLDTPSEERFDQLVLLAKQVFNVPMVSISLVDKDRQWFKSCIGIAASETSRDVSFCTYVVFEKSTILVADAQRDPRFANNPFVLGAPYIRFYAGYPLRGMRGHPIGTFCLVDIVPRNFDERQLWMFNMFGRIVQLELQAAFGREEQAV